MNTTVVRNVYVDRTVVNNTTVVNRAAFNGEGGVNARASADEQRWSNENHVQPTSEQMTHEQNMRTTRGQFASVNGG